MILRMRDPCGSSHATATGNSMSRFIWSTILDFYPLFITFLIFSIFFVSSFPCDVTGDISYEELRAMAYEEAKRGITLQSIVRLTFLMFVNTTHKT